MSHKDCRMIDGVTAGSLAQRRMIFVSLAATLLVLVAIATAAQESSVHATKRPKIGLVLEGGGALGLAHIGVIQWLEEHRIPVSYVAGTSMGGLVGGAYATGNSPNQIRDLITGIDWNKVIAGKTPFQDLSFRRKQDAQDYPNSLEFGLRNGIRFPEGFNSGHQVQLILDRIALPYSEVKNFDDLPIPFGCVSTDLVSGKEIVFRSGSLARALRSTMSLPGIFTPVRDDDRIYADGALLNNLPVDVAQQMGADLILAVHLQVKPLDPKEPLSSFGVLGRSVSVVIAANELKSMERADLLINVPVSDFKSLEFERADALIKQGYEAAGSKAVVLSAFSLDESSWKDFLAQRNSRRQSTLPAVQFVDVTGTSPRLAEMIKSKLAGMVGKPLDTQALDSQLTIFTGIGRFSSLGYQMINQQGRTGLLITAEEKPYAPPTVQPAIQIDGSDYENPVFSTGARITFFDLGGFGRELRNDFILGAQYGARTEYFVPLRGGSNWFVAPQAFADNSPFNAYSDDKLVAEYRRQEVGGSFDIGYEFGRDGEVRVGYQASYLKFTPKIGNTSVLPGIDGRVGISRVAYELNRLDDPVIPRSGVALRFFGGWYDANPGAMGGFPKGETEFEIIKRLNRPSSLALAALGGTTFGYSSIQTGLPVFSLGGNQRLAAYGSNEILANQYFLFQTTYLRELVALPPLIGDRLYFLMRFEIGKPYDVSNSAGLPKASRLPTDVVGGFVVNTLIGPILIGGSVGDTGHSRFFFKLGRIF